MYLTVTKTGEIRVGGVEIVWPKVVSLKAKGVARG